MRRVAIIGNAGGGKSTLARRLAQVLAIPVFSVDDVQWEAGWQPAAPDKVAAAHAAWLAQPRWIIDGWGAWDLVRTRLRAADSIVLVDFPLRIHYYWALKRQLRVTLGFRDGWPPPGCRALPITLRLLQRMRDLHVSMRPQLLRLLAEPELRDRVMILHSPSELRVFRDAVAMELPTAM
jgi:hypothetical protein